NYLKPWVDRLAFQREDAEHTLVYSTQRFAANETLQGFDTERELTQGKRTLGSEATIAESCEVRVARIVGAIDDAQVLASTALHGGLNESLLSLGDEVEWLYDHPFAAALG